MSTLEELLASLDGEQRKALLAQLENDDVNQSSPEAVLADIDTISRRASASAPLSSAQRGLWFLHQLRPEDSAYNICYAIDWPRPPEVAALSAALDDLTSRHEILRTTFPAGAGGEPSQVVLPALHVPLAAVDLADDDLASYDQWTHRTSTQPFDLERGPLIRTTLIRSGARSTLVLAVHHIVFDARSAEILLTELVTLYQARLTGRPAGLDQLPVQYGDFAAWQHEQLADQTLGQHRAYWHGRLAGLEALQLPADRQRGWARTSAGAVRPFAVPAGLRSRLVAVGRQHEATLFMVLLAGFAALLHRYTGRDDLAVGTSVSSRNRPELEGLIGYFLNTLVLRCDLSQALSFGDLVAQVRQTVLDAFEHQDVPFEQLVEYLAPERELGVLPLVPVLFAFNASRSASQPAAAGQPVVRGVAGQGARADLTLTLYDSPQGLRGSIEFDLALFDPETIERMAGRLLRLLWAAALDPELPVFWLPIMTEEESAELASWNATAGVSAAAGTLTEMFARQARLAPGRIAVRDDLEQLSYAELDRRSERIAGWLRAAGIGAGRPVGVLLPRSVEQVVALAAVLKAGGAYLPLDPAYPPDRLAFMLADAGAQVVISRSGCAVPGDFAPRTLDWPTSAVRSADESPRTVLLLDQPWPDASLAPLAAAPAAEPVHPDQPAYIIYTSGSTGRPKGVVNTHRGVVNQLHWMIGAFGVSASDVIIYKTPMSFDVSLWELLLPAMVGAEMVVASPGGHLDPAYLTDLIERRGATMIHFVPSMLQAFLADADAGTPARCRSLRQVLCSGEALTAAVRDRFYAAGLTAALDNLYGPTEAAIDVTHWACARDQDGEVPIGRPILNTTTYVLDARGEQLPVGIPGELYLGGDQLALGYASRPGRTGASFVPDPFSDQPARRLYRTGDLARWRLDGALEFLGRKDHQVKLRGHRIELAEIEGALRTHRSVADAVVLVAGAGGEARLVAYVVPAGDPAPSTAGLREHLAGTLPAYMVPASYAVIARIPLTGNGKADRSALLAVAPQAIYATAYTAPREPFETVIAGLFTELTGTERVSAHDDFFCIGGHSLLALRLRARLHSELGVDLALSEVFDDPTVEGLTAKVIRQILAWAVAAEAAELLDPSAAISES